MFICRTDANFELIEVSSTRILVNTFSKKLKKKLLINHDLDRKYMKYTTANNGRKMSCVGKGLAG